MTLLGRSWLSIMWARAARNSVIASNRRISCRFYIGAVRRVQPAGPRPDQHSTAQPAVSPRAGKAAGQQLIRTADGASRERFRRVVRARIDAGGAAGAAAQAKRYRSLDPDDRGDRDRAHALRFVGRAPGQIVPRPSAAPRAGLAR